MECSEEEEEDPKNRREMMRSERRSESGLGIVGTKLRANKKKKFHRSETRKVLTILALHDWNDLLSDSRNRELIAIKNMT